MAAEDHPLYRCALAGAIDRLIDDIDHAHHHVHLLFYIYGDDETALNQPKSQRDAQAAIQNAARRNIAQTGTMYAPNLGMNSGLGSFGR